MDWTKCLAAGLQNQKVFDKVYEAYSQAHKKRNEHIAKMIDETLKEGEIGILLMREGHQVQFTADIEVFYVSPPGLDEIKRWRRYPRASPWHFINQASLDALRAIAHSPTGKPVELCPSGDLELEKSRPKKPRVRAPRSKYGACYK
jgi:hypothetical protein